MNQTIKAVLLTVGSGFLMVIVLVMVYISMLASAVRGEQMTRNAFTAQLESNKSAFDKQWKIISQMAQVPVAERESLKDTYTSIMLAERGVAGNGQLASFFKQAKIDISPVLFGRLMTTIESQREAFHREQQKLVQLKKQNDDYRTIPPSSWFVGSKSELELHLVTSSKTEESFASGKDDDVTLFKPIPKKE